MNHTIIEFNNFSFKYHAQAEPTLFDVNLKINKGEKVLVLGPSGSGKSTIAHCINIDMFQHRFDVEGYVVTIKDIRCHVSHNINRKDKSP